MNRCDRHDEDFYSTCASCAYELKYGRVIVKDPTVPTLNAQVSFTGEELLLPDDQWQALLDATIWCLKSGVNLHRRELQAEEKKCG